MPRPATFDHLRSKKKPNTQKVEIVLDPELQDILIEARAKMESARESGNQELIEEAANELAEAMAENEDNLVVFKLRSIGGRKYDDLIAEHPITPDQEKKIRDQGGDAVSWNTDTFPPALIVASLVEPKLTHEEFMEIWKSDDWGASELLTLFMAAMGVNASHRQVDWGKG